MAEETVIYEVVPNTYSQVPTTKYYPTKVDTTIEQPDWSQLTAEDIEGARQQASREYSGKRASTYGWGSEQKKAYAYFLASYQRGNLAEQGWTSTLTTYSPQKLAGVTVRDTSTGETTYYNEIEQGGMYEKVKAKVVPSPEYLKQVQQQKQLQNVFSRPSVPSLIGNTFGLPSRDYTNIPQFQTSRERVNLGIAKGTLALGEGSAEFIVNLPYNMMSNQIRQGDKFNLFKYETPIKVKTPLPESLGGLRVAPQSLEEGIGFVMPSVALATYSTSSFLTTTKGLGLLGKTKFLAYELAPIKPAQTIYMMKPNLEWKSLSYKTNTVSKGYNIGIDKDYVGVNYNKLSPFEKSLRTEAIQKTTAFTTKSGQVRGLATTQIKQPFLKTGVDTEFGTRTTLIKTYYKQDWGVKSFGRFEPRTTSFKGIKTNPETFSFKRLKGIETQGLSQRVVETTWTGKKGETTFFKWDYPQRSLTSTYIKPTKKFIDFEVWTNKNLKFVKGDTGRIYKVTTAKDYVLGVRRLENFYGGLSTRTSTTFKVKTPSYSSWVDRPSKYFRFNKRGQVSLYSQTTQPFDTSIQIPRQPRVYGDKDVLPITNIETISTTPTSRGRYLFVPITKGFALNENKERTRIFPTIKSPQTTITGYKQRQIPSLKIAQIPRQETRQRQRQIVTIETVTPFVTVPYTPPPPPPTTIIPLSLPALNLDLGAPLGRWKKRRQPKKYTPSFEALVFNIRGKRPKGMETGLRVRPITRGFKFFNVRRLR